MAEGPVVDGDLHKGEIMFSAPNLCGWYYRLCIGATSTVLKIYLGWFGASSLLVSGFYFLGDLLTILSTFEDSRSIMGGSDVVHCVWVPLTSTIVAEFWAWGVCLGLVSVHFPSLCTISWTLGAPLLLLCNGPMSQQCSQGFCLILWLIM